MVLADLPRVSSAKAAAIVDIGYEGFRSYLKRGLLGRVGLLPGFHRAGSHTSDDPVPRSGWMTFGFGDLCLMRIAKLLMEVGFTFESAKAVVSQHDLWSAIAHDEEPTRRHLLIWPPYGDHILFGPNDLRHLDQSLTEASAHGVVALLNLAEVQQHVAKALSATTERVSHRDARDVTFRAS